MKIGTKIYLSVSFLIIFLAISGYYSVLIVRSISDHVVHISNEEYPINEAITNYQRGAYQLWVGTFTSQNDPVMGTQLVKNGKKTMEKSRSSLDSKIDVEIIDELASKEMSAISSSDTLLDTFEKSKETVVDASSTVDFATQIKFNSSLLQQKISSLNLTLSTMVDESQERIGMHLRDANADSGNAINMISLSVIISLLIAFFIALFIIVSVVRPINQLNKVVDVITSGNLDAQLPVVKNKEVSNLVGAVEMLLSVIKINKNKK